MGILRIRFTVADLSRTRILITPDPTWEIVGALHRLQTHLGRHSYPEWRRRVTRDLAGHPSLATLIPLLPRAAYFPDFLTPAPGADLDTAIDHIQHTPRARLRRELDRLTPPAHARALVTDLAAGRTPALKELGDALRAFHRIAIAPDTITITATVAADRALRATKAITAGAGHLLDDLGPTIRWQPPVLTVDGYPHDRDLDLAGRGITLIPSHFCWRHPITLADPGLPPVLVYPALRTGTPAPPHHLAPLIGHTRLTVLQSTGPGATTTELARRAGIAPATASEHATVLRNAGLITSHRHGNLMIHHLTELGSRLLTRDSAAHGSSGSPPPPPAAAPPSPRCSSATSSTTHDPATA